MSRIAAFYDMDGTLVRTNLFHSYLFFSQNQPTFVRAGARLTSAFAEAPLFWAVDKVSRTKFNRMLYAGYKGIFQDRFEELSQEHFEKVLKPNLFPGAKGLIESGRQRGFRQVIVSGSLDYMVAPLARYLGVDDIITNRLEFVDHVATGRLLPPVLAGAAKARAIQEYAKRHNIDLLESYGFSDSHSDYAMLSVVGRPAVVNPDRKLRAAAREANWPVLSF